jgi:hypothetical protein
VCFLEQSHHLLCCCVTLVASRCMSCCKSRACYGRPLHPVWAVGSVKFCWPSPAGPPTAGPAQTSAYISQKFAASHNLTSKKIQTSFTSCSIFVFSRLRSGYPRRLHDHCTDQNYGRTHINYVAENTHCHCLTDTAHHSLLQHYPHTTSS